MPGASPQVWLHHKGHLRKVLLVVCFSVCLLREKCEVQRLVPRLLTLVIVVLDCPSRGQPPLWLRRRERNSYCMKTWPNDLQHKFQICLSSCPLASLKTNVLLCPTKNLDAILDSSPSHFFHPGSQYILFLFPKQLKFFSSSSSSHWAKPSSSVSTVAS